MIHKKISLFDDRPEVTLTTYIMDDSKEMLDGGGRPAVIINPGGAYLNCSDREAEPIAMQFAAMGYHAFVLRYSVFMEGMDIFSGEVDLGKTNPNTRYPNPMIELGKAMLVVREHAEEWMVDTDRIAVCGFSAGGHNAAMYSVYWNEGMISEALGVETKELKPAACILAYPITDYILLYEEGNAGQHPMIRQLFELSAQAYLGEARLDTEILKKVSPAQHVTTDTPPMFLWATSEDQLVAVEHTARMGVALAAEQIPFELHVFESGDHGLATATQAAASTQDQVNETAAGWITLADRWLKKRFALKLKDPVKY